MARDRQPGALAAAFALAGLVAAGGCNLAGRGFRAEPVVPDRPGAPTGHMLRVGQWLFFTPDRMQADDPLVTDLLGLERLVTESLRLGRATRPVLVTIFADRGGYEDFLRRHYPTLPTRRALYIRERDGEQRVLACRGDRLRRDLRHEIVHALVQRAGVALPMWADEGLAEHFELGPGRELGNPAHVRALRTAWATGWRPDLARLERLREPSAMTAADYREAWLWVHLCLLGEPADHVAFHAWLADAQRGAAGPLGDRLRPLHPDLAGWFKAGLDRLPDDEAALADQPQTYPAP